MSVEPISLLRILSRLLGYRRRRAIHPMPQKEREQPSISKADATVACVRYAYLQYFKRSYYNVIDETS